jgi:predicted ATPase/DNA-binding SARP family transcriptional activator
LIKPSGWGKILAPHPEPYGLSLYLKRATPVSHLDLRFLGPPQIGIDGKSVSLSRRKSLALLAYLAVTGENQRRDALAALFWPESNQARARASLRREIWYLNQMLGEEWLETVQETIAIHRGCGVWLDTRQFESDMAGLQATETTAESLTLAQIEGLEKAIALYRGDFLAGFNLPDSPEFDDWHFFQTEGYRQQLATTLQVLITSHSDRGDYEQAIYHGRRWLALDPLHEQAHCQLMRLYALAGQQAAALRQYQECARILAEELDVQPEEETASLYEMIRNRRFPPVGGVTESIPAAPLPAIASPICHLPAPMTPFVGREAEIADVLDLLGQVNCRLLTITGVGGMGKTRLSIAVAAQAAPHFADGVSFVPLADVERPQAMLAAIATQLDVPDAGAADIIQRLHTFLRTKQLLLVLDNFEHLMTHVTDSAVDPVELLSALLQKAPHLTILVTSQERLNLVEEWIYPLEGLAYPPEGRPDAGGGYAAIEFFAQCAYKSRPDFDPEAERPHIASICRLVEGMPLGIELAASWVRSLSCAEIVAELVLDLDFLTTPLRNLPTRHRSLRALFNRSWALLSPQEQTILGRLSVFRGGFDRAAAVEVAGATPLPLTALVDRSLIRRQPSGRYDMHGLLYQFVSEQFAQQLQERKETQARHAAFYADLVARAGWELEPGDPKAAAALHSESANVQATWRWAIEQKKPEPLHKTMKWLVNDFRRRGEHSVGYRIFNEAIEAFRPHESNDDRILAGLLGSLYLRQAQCAPHAYFADGANPLEKSVALLRRASPPDPLDLALALVSLGHQYASQGYNSKGEHVLEEGLALFRKYRNPLGIGATLRDWGMLEMGWGRLHLAQQRLEESVRLLESCDQPGSMQSTFLSGVSLLMRGHYRRAEALIQRALRFFVEHGEKNLAGHALRNLGDLYTATGDFGQAEQAFARANTYFDSVGRQWEVTLTICLSPAVLARLQDDPNAERLLIDAVATARQIGFQQRIATSLHHLSRLRHDQRDYEGALALLDEALYLARQIDFRYATALVLTQQGHSYLALNQIDSASQSFAEALQISREEGIDRVAVDALSGVADLVAQAGDSEQAVLLLQLAHAHPASEYETRQRAEARLLKIAWPESVSSVQEHNSNPLFDLEEATRLAEELVRRYHLSGTDHPSGQSAATVETIGRDLNHPAGDLYS